MNTIVSEYETGLEAPVNEDYGDEVLCAGWNPQLVLASANPVTQLNRPVNPLADLANADVDTFMKRMYEHQR